MMSESGRVDSGAEGKIYSVRRTCRVCGSTALTPVLDLGNQYPAGWLVDHPMSPDDRYRIPIDLVRCDPSREHGACGLVQLRHTVRADRLYSEYYYQSGINRSMRSNLTSIVELALGHVPVSDGDLVLDIGCNDGTLLNAYPAIGLEKAGFDPSDVAMEAARTGNTVIRELFSGRAFLSAFSGRKARIITSIAMLYDLEDPTSFVKDVADCLDASGVWITEQSYLPLMLERNAFDSVCHEHLEYYSLQLIKRLVESSGLEIVSAELNDINGGSIRLAVAHRGQFSIRKEDDSFIQRLLRREDELDLNDEDIYRRFRDGVEAIRTNLLEFLRRAKRDGKLVHGYGASTKGNTILQYCGIDSDLVNAIADRNPRKWGRYTIGSNIKIVSEARSRRQRPDYYLVLPWHFMEEFLEREAGFLSQGGEFVVPMPTVHLVGETRGRPAPFP